MILFVLELLREGRTVKLVHSSDGKIEVDPVTARSSVFLALELE